MKKLKSIFSNTEGPYLWTCKGFNGKKESWLCGVYGRPRAYFYWGYSKSCKRIVFSFKKLLVVNVACYKANALLPNGENAHITVRSPDWWKGVFDAISIGYENIEVMLICSNTFTSGVIFESFKFGDWASTEGFTTTMSFKTFQPN